MRVTIDMNLAMKYLVRLVSSWCCTIWSLKQDFSISWI